ncbi:unnamed protein product [Rangifer tarandus platyrhynchus]|uniref:Uncharacterized protein n=1 Tax=Rangifer tarandus platyrhynchus TaxID=3082113 RepID=A0ABN8YFN8_RANTA|nr:unnamed protein product [Rangifer tarandus platyrhynchus]
MVSGAAARGGGHWAGGWGGHGEEGRAESKVDTSVLEIAGRAKACLSHKRDFVNQRFLGQVVPPLGMSFRDHGDHAPPVAALHRRSRPGGTPAECSRTETRQSPRGRLRNLGLGPSPPRTPVGPRQAASTSGPGVLTRDAGAHAACTRPGSHCKALEVQGWGGKPLAGPHPPPGWDPGQAVSGPAAPLPAPGGCKIAG